MLFDMSASSNSRKIMQLNPEYPKDVTMKSTDGTAVFKAEIAKHGRPDEYTYQWYVNGAAVAEANHKEYERNISGDKGQYTVWCEVTNKAGTVRTRIATLTVNRLPVLDENYPADASVTVAKSATFEIKITEAGYPDSYTYQWYVNETLVEGATEASYTRTGAAFGIEKIHCVVTNDAGSVKSRTAIFNINQEFICSEGKFGDGGGWGYSTSDENSSVTIPANYMQMIADGGGSTRAWSSNAYEFTGKNKLVFYCPRFSASSATDVGTFFFGASSVKNDDSFVACSSVIAHNNTTGEYVVVDVSNLSGMYYIKIADIRNCYNQDQLWVQHIYFE